MKLRQLLILIIITAAVVYAALSFWNQRAPVAETEKNWLFPELAARVNDVKIVKIKGFEDELILAYQGDQWVIQSSDNFPAQAEKVKKLILGLSELKIDSAKTSNPALYSRLAVEGPFERKTASKLLYLLDENGELIASIVLGKYRESNTAIPAMYVRLPDAEQALLVQGQVEASSEEKDWFENEIINLSAEEVQSVSIQHPDQAAFTLLRDDQGQVNFNLAELPNGKKAQSEIILNRLGRVLENIRAHGVKSTETVDMNNESTRVTVKTFRGLIVNIQVKAINDDYYANFHFDHDQEMAAAKDNTATDEEADAGDPEQEVKALNQYISPWAFKIQKFKFDDLTTELSQLVR